jgi:hypothetical protein
VNYISTVKRVSVVLQRDVCNETLWTAVMPRQKIRTQHCGKMRFSMTSIAVFSSQVVFKYLNDIVFLKLKLKFLRHLNGKFHPCCRMRNACAKMRSMFNHQKGLNAPVQRRTMETT